MQKNSFRKKSKNATVEVQEDIAVGQTELQ